MLSRARRDPKMGVTLCLGRTQVSGNCEPLSMFLVAPKRTSAGAMIQSRVNYYMEAYIHRIGLDKDKKKAMSHGQYFLDPVHGLF